jgi:hypothetical protein
MAAEFESLEPTTPTNDSIPPLRIHHLLACAAVAAVQLSLWRVCHPYYAEYFSATGAALEAIRQSLNAAGLTCALFSIYWHFKGHAGLAQPGQCLLIGHAFSALELYLMVLLRWLLGPDIGTAASNLNSNWVFWLIFNGLYAAIFFGTAAFYGWCAWKVADTLPWRFTFALLSLTVLAVQPWSLLATRSGYSRVVAVMIPVLAQGGTVLLLEIWAAADDLYSRRARFWTHWVGIALSMMAQTLLIVWCLINWFHWF